MCCPSSTSVDLGARVSEPDAILLLSSEGQQGGWRAGGRRQYTDGLLEQNAQQLGSWLHSGRLLLSGQVVHAHMASMLGLLMIAPAATSMLGGTQEQLIGNILNHPLLHPAPPPPYL